MLKVKAKSTTPSNLERQNSNVIIQQNFYHIQTTRGSEGPLIILTLHPIKKHKPTNKHTNHQILEVISLRNILKNLRKKKKAQHRSGR